MAVISVVSNCQETAAELETALRGRGHVIRTVADVRPGAKPVPGDTGLFVVDMDCDAGEAVEQVRALAESETTAFTPVLVAASPESMADIAVACAYGATGLLRKPFRTVETASDTERALVAAYPAK